MGKRTALQWRPAIAVAAMTVAAGVPLSAAAQEKAQVVRDAETGELRAPTAQEAAALRAAGGPAESRASTAREIRHKNGAVEMRLDESTMMYSVARRQADGSITQACVQGEAKAHAATLAPASFAKPLRPTAVARTARGAVYEDQ
jgi:hypothetical protein